MSANWLQMADGRVINFDGVTNLSIDNNAIILNYSSGKQDRVTYDTPDNAARGLADISNLLGVGVTTTLSLQAATPNLIASGSPQTFVVSGTGFAADMGTAVFAGHIYIGTDVILGGSGLTYVNNQTLLITYTPSVPGTFDIQYFKRDGSLGVTLPNGIQIT